MLSTISCQVIWVLYIEEEMKGNSIKFCVVTSIFPDRKISRPWLAVFAFATQNKNIAAPGWNLGYRRGYFSIYKNQTTLIFIRCRRQLSLCSEAEQTIGSLDKEKSFDSNPQAKQLACSGVYSLRSCAPGWNRTNDPLLKRQVLYRLSYGRIYENVIKNISENQKMSIF